MAIDKIVIKGAREHNLKDIDVEIPRDKLVVFTGLSGSGKSSLAFDTIYADGQRRYVESLSSYARQFLGQMEKPNVDSIEGLSPAISIDQKTTSKNPRSTVGTVTEIYDYLRLLYARIGVPHCPICGREITQQTVAQMAIILLISRPFQAALDLVRLIAFPMITMNALGMVVFIRTFNRVFIEEDSVFAGKMRLALRIADQSLPHLRKGLYSTADMESTAQIIYQSISCAAVMITDTRKILAFCGDPKYTDLKTDRILAPILKSIQDKKATTFVSAERQDPLYSLLKGHTIIAAPLIEHNEPIGSLTIMVKKQWHTSEANVSFADELARLFSTQLELSDLEYQKKLRRKAELRALQSQVNPHFLYNALNTISYVCRENPNRARELILTLSSYYRQTLENDRYMLSLHTELYHVNSYLELEKARFEEKLSVEIHVDENLDCMVPSFILQPLVENAVRYGADKSGSRFVSIRAVRRGGLAEISVSDHGPGIPPTVLENLQSGAGNEGVGLENVHRRLKSIYGEENGLQAVNTPEGACVYFTVPAEGLPKYDAV